MESFLERNHLVTRVSNEHLVVKECPFCHPIKGLEDNMWKLYVLQKNGAFKCFRCNAQGSWYDLQNRMLKQKGMDTLSESLQPVSGSPTPEPISGTPVEATAASASASMGAVSTPAPVRPSQGLPPTALDNELAMRYLEGTRGLNRDVIQKYKVGTTEMKFGTDSHQCLTFPWLVPDEVNPDKHLMVRYKVRAINEKRHQRLVPKGGGWGLFGWHMVRPEHNEILLTEGVFDAMAVHQAMDGIPAVSLPSGASNLPVQVLPLLERFNKIYLWMDDDAVGQEAARKFADKLGPGRCFIVRSNKKQLPEDASPPKDANEALQNFGPDMVRSMVEGAQRVPHSRIVGFNELRYDILHDLMCPEKIEGVKSATLPRLNEVMKGHRRGELTVLTGPTGSGKTTLLSQLSLDYCSQGVNTLWGSFEIRNTRLARKMLSQYAATSLELEVDLDNFDAVADRFEELPLNFMRFHGSSDVEEVLDAMDYAVYAYDVEHVILDNLQFMMSGQGRGYERFEQQDRAIEKFRKFATQRNVHVTLVIHPRKEPDNEPLGMQSLFGGAKATQEADNILILQMENKRKYLEVKKNRFDGDLGRIFLRFNKPTQSFVSQSAAEVQLLASTSPPGRAL